MRNLSLSIILIVLIVLIVSVQGSTGHKHSVKERIHRKYVVKTVHRKKASKVTTSVTKDHKPTPGYDYVPPVKIDADSIHAIPISENKAEQEDKKKEEESSSTGTVTFVGLALVAVAAGGMSYRNKAKKQLESPELFRYKFENNTIYDCTPKNNSLTYSFNSNEFREEQPRINIYDNSPSTSKRNSGSISTEVIFEDDEAEDAKRLNVVLPTNRAYKVVLPWDARCVDEIQLNCGDLVCIKECYQDGYSLGRNLTTRFDGIFPTCCLDNIGSSINQQEVAKWQSVGMYSLPKRSVKPTKKAKRASRGISLLTMPDWTKKLESLKLDSPSNNIF